MNPDSLLGDETVMAPFQGYRHATAMNPESLLGDETVMAPFKNNRAALAGSADKDPDVVGALLGDATVMAVPRQRCRPGLPACAENLEDPLGDATVVVPRQKDRAAPAASAEDLERTRMVPRQSATAAPASFPWQDAPWSCSIKEDEDEDLEATRLMGPRRKVAVTGQDVPSVSGAKSPAVASHSKERGYTPKVAEADNATHALGEEDLDRTDPDMPQAVPVARSPTPCTSPSRKAAPPGPGVDPLLQTFSSVADARVSLDEVDSRLFGANRSLTRQPSGSHSSKARSPARGGGVSHASIIASACRPAAEAGGDDGSRRKTESILDGCVFRAPRAKARCRRS